MDRQQLEAASKRGLISEQQIDPLHQFLQSGPAVATGESVQQRFTRGFGDVFITLGILFVTVAAAQLQLSSYFNALPIVLLLAASEWLIRSRRLVLPGIALLISLLYFASQLTSFSSSQQLLPDLLFLTSLAALFYLRYKLPFSLLVIAAGLIAICNSLLSINWQQVQSVFAIYGLILFMIAMWFDSQDTERQSRLSDCAFWLHLLAAPLVVHAVMSSLLISTNSIIYIIAFFITFFVIALYVDRRALLVSSLSYAIYAVINLANSNALHIENKTLLVFVAFGAFIIFFGAYWHKARTMLFSATQNSLLAHYVPTFKQKN